MLCQKCRTPILLDGSLESLNPAAFKLLTDSSGLNATGATVDTRSSRQVFPAARYDEYKRISEQAQSPAIKRNALASQPGAEASPKADGKHHNSAMSFIMLSESQVVEARNDRLSKKSEPPSKATERDKQPTAGLAEVSPQDLEKTTRLFEIMSARSDIDHPICIECTDMLVDGLQRRLVSATKERDAYVEFLRQANADIPTDEEVRQAEKELEQSMQKEKEAFAELERLEKEKATLDDEILALEVESAELDAEEEAFWSDRNAFAAKLATLQNQRESADARHEHDSRQLQQLQRTNVYNDIFNIGHDGNFVTINNLRLGRSDKPAVEWAEINAALGQTCLLLSTMADRLDFTFQGFDLRPLGSTSTIYRHEQTQGATSNDPSHPTKIKKTEYPLHNTGDFGFGGLVGFHGKFDQGMVCFLECVRQLGEHMAQTPMQNADGRTIAGPKLPYEIHKDKINGLSIKLGFNQDESWSKACKWMLTCCKFILAHASRIADVSRKAP